MPAENTVPDYIIFDELKRERARRERATERPRLEVPSYTPVWPDDSEGRVPMFEEREEREERGEVIIPMW